MTRLAVLVVLALLPAGVGLADMLPPQPPQPLPPEPPPPRGPSQAVIRGLSVERIPGPVPASRWQIAIRACDGVAACSEAALLRCVVTEANGKSVMNGDMTSLMSADRAASGKPMQLTLAGCALPRIVLDAKP